MYGQPQTAEEIESHCSGSDAEDGVTRNRGGNGNFLRFSAALQTWASDYPFPTFRKKKTSSEERSDDGAADGGLSQAQSERRTRSTEESDSDDDHQKPLRIAAPHPHASDLALEHHQRSWQQHMNDSALRLQRAASASSSMNASTSMFATLMRHAAENSQTQKIPVSMEEAATLLAIARGSAQTRSVDVKHLDLSWLSEQRAPGCHLHLGNLHLRIDDPCDRNERGTHRTLVNSPRSAVVLLRNGVSITAFLRRPWARKRFTHAQSFGALDTLTSDERKEYSLELLRQKRLEVCTAEYAALCLVSDFDEIVSMCSSIVDQERRLQAAQSVSTLAGAAGRPSVARSKTTVTSSAVLSAVNRRPQSSLSCLRRRVVDVSRVSEETVMLKPVVKRAHLLDAKTEQTIQEIDRKSTSAALHRAEDEARRLERLVLRSGKEELAKAQRIAAAGVSAYRKLLLEQRSRARELDAQLMMTAKSVSQLQLQEANRVARIVEDKTLQRLSLLQDRRTAASVARDM